MSYEEIEKIILNNQELKSLQNLVTSAKFNLSSKLRKGTHLNLQANGLPNYISGKKYSSDLQTLKTSQFTANPLTIRWDLIEPLEDQKLKLPK